MQSRIIRVSVESWEELSKLAKAHNSSISQEVALLLQVRKENDMAAMISDIAAKLDLVLGKTGGSTSAINRANPVVNSKSITKGIATAINRAFCDGATLPDEATYYYDNGRVFFVDAGGAEHTITELDEEDLRTLEKEFDIVLD